MDFSKISELLKPEQIEKLNFDELQALYELIKPYRIYQQYNRIEFVTPFDYQEKFFEAGFKFNHRYLSAANR